MLRADAPEQRLPRTRRPPRRALRRIFRGYELVVSPSSSCVGTMREVYGARRTTLRALGVPRPPARRRTTSVRRFPHRVAYHPTCHSLRVTRVGDAPQRLLRSVRGPRAGGASAGHRNAAASAAPSRSRTPIHPPRCSPTSATRIEAERRRVLHRSRRIVPAADRRRSLATKADRACAPRISRRSWRATESSGRALPDRRAARARQPAAPHQPAQRDGHDPRQACAGRRRAPRLGGAARGGPRDQGERARAPRRVPRPVRGGRRAPPAGTCTGRATQRRRTPSSPKSHARTEWARSSR